MEEVSVLIQKAQAGDSCARDILIEKNLGLVHHIVKRFAGRGYDPEDLFQTGTIGLMKAIDHFDPSFDVRFSTYAVPMIVGEIRRYLRDNQVIRVSRHLKDLSYQIFRLKEAYVHEHHEEPSIAYLAEKCGIKEKDVIDAMDACQSVLSIFEPIYSSDGDELYLLDQIKDEHDEIAKERDVISLHQSMHALNARELDIIRRRYYEDQTQMEIATELGISQAQVSRLEKNAIRSLRRQMDQ